VAGIIGSKTYGVAKAANMIDVKKLSGSGTGDLSAVIAGIDFAVNNHRQTGRKSVANLSLGAAFNSVLNSAVNAAVDSGLPMIVAAGNSNSAACASSPASAAKAITVGAIDDRYDTIVLAIGEVVLIYLLAGYM
jgi:subtilase-type proteinase RRT12